MKRKLHIVVGIHVVLGLTLIALGLIRYRQTIPVSEIPSVETIAPLDSKGPDWPVFHGASDLTGVIEGSLNLPLSLLWQFKTQGDLLGSAAVVGQRVFVGSSDKKLYALDLTSGDLIWSLDTDGALEASVTVVGDQVVVGSRRGTVYAVDINSGQVNWSYETGGQIAGAANRFFLETSNIPHLLVGSYDSRLYCLNGQTGEPVWSYETESYVNGTAAIAHGLCAFGGCDATVHVVNIADGNAVQTADAGAYVAGSGAIKDGIFYAGNYDGALMAFDLGNSELLWTTHSDGNEPDS